MSDALPLSLVAGLVVVYFGLNAPRRSRSHRVALATACALVALALGCAVLWLTIGGVSISASAGMVQP